LVYADYVNILGGCIHTIKKNGESLLAASKETGLEVNARSMYSSPNNVQVIKSRMRWAGHVARKGNIEAHTVLVGKPEGKRPLGGPRRR
jgi:hypothetical protein